ncbi:disease resistance protein [Salix suchowensis]|nr:disease resistance protein [Salix suchowensis]
MEGDPPSFMEDDVNQLDFETLMSELPSYVILEHFLSEDDCLQFSFSTLDTLMSEFPSYDILNHGSRLPPEEVPVNQSSMLCNDQVGQNMLVDNNDCIQQTTQFPLSFPQIMTTMGGLDGTSSSWINQNGPNWPQTASSDQQCTNQLAMSNQVPGMLPQPPMTQWHQNSFIHQPQPGHVYMTQNATTSQHGGFNQPTPRYPIFHV